MSLFGKILAFVNVFAVLGALALIAMDYAKRRVWEHAVMRQDLMLKGLPIDETDTDALQQRRVDLIDAPTQKELFGGVNPVTTQKAEVDRVKSSLSSKIQSAGDKKQQIVVLARILMPMADTSEQWERMIAYQTHLRDEKSFKQLRDRLTSADKLAKQPPKEGKPKPYDQAFHEALAAQFAEPLGPLGEEFLAVKMADPRADVDKALDQSLDVQLDQLQKQFEQVFRDTVTGAVADSSKPGATSQRRRVIARLLFNMVDVLPEGQTAPNLDLMANPAYKRFVMVVGVHSAAEAVNEQAAILQDIVAQVALEREKERSLFASEHRKELDLVRDKRNEVERHALLLAIKKSELENHEGSLRKRRVDIENYKNQLATARRETSEHLKQVRQMSDALFQERVRLRDNSESNQKLEKQIRTLEVGR